MITRRHLFGVLAGAVAAPIIVRPGLIMPVKALKPDFIKIEIVNDYTITRGYWSLDVEATSAAARLPLSAIWSAT